MSCREAERGHYANYDRVRSLLGDLEALNFRKLTENTGEEVDNEAVT